MLAAGIMLIIIGYGFAYAGISNLATAGKGWGLIQSLVPPGGLAKTVSATGAQANGLNASLDALFQPSAPVSGTTPATGGTLPSNPATPPGSVIA